MKNFGVLLLLVWFVLVWNVSAINQFDINRMREYWLTKYGTVSEFWPFCTIQRGEAAKFVVSRSRSTGWESAILQWIPSCDFQDTYWYDFTLEPYIQYACEYWIIKWFNWRYLPRNTMTQAEALAMSIRLVDGIQDETRSPWRRSYYELWQKYWIIQYEDIYAMGYTDITRWEFGERLTDLWKMKQDRYDQEKVFERESEVEDILQQLEQNDADIWLDVLSIENRYGWTSGDEEFYIMRVRPQVYGWQPENMIVQTSISKNHCLELPDNNLPKDFTYVSTNNWRSWHSIRRAKTIPMEYRNNRFLCGPALVKVEMPRDRWIFDDGLAFPIMTISRYADTCQEFIVSADNAQYSEDKLCY